jgi:hypothetical protein
MVTVLTPLIWDGQAPHHRYEARPHGHGHWGHANFRDRPGTVPPRQCRQLGTRQRRCCRCALRSRVGQERHGVALGDTLAEKCAGGVVRPGPGPQRAQAWRRLQRGSTRCRVPGWPTHHPSGLSAAWAQPSSSNRWRHNPAVCPSVAVAGPSTTRRDPRDSPSGGSARRS